MKKLLFILNPNAGQRRANRFLPEIVRLFHDYEYRCELYVTGASGDAAYFAATYGGACDMVVCAGGDGTLNETVSGLLTGGHRCPVGYIPCGTTNDYAASIGLSDDPLEAARDIMEGEPKPFDVGVFNGKYFIYTATCGAFARASYTTPQAAKNMLGHAAYVLEGARDLMELKPMRMRIETEEYDLDDEFLFCAITNATSIGGILKLDDQLVALNDGKFEVLLVRNPVNPAQLSTILYGLTTMDIPNEMIHFFSSSSLAIHCDELIDWTLDGEKAPETKTVKLQNLHSAMRLCVPNHLRDNPVLSANPFEDEL